MTMEFNQISGDHVSPGCADWVCGDYTIVANNDVGTKRYWVYYRKRSIATDLKTFDCALAAAMAHKNTLTDIENEGIN